jgi:hypothetical protein
MPLQIGLAGLVLASAFLSPWLPMARPLMLASVLLFLGASVPLARRATATDPALAGFVPLLLFGRSLAQGLGLTAGLATTWLGGAARRTQAIVGTLRPILRPRRP